MALPSSPDLSFERKHAKALLRDVTAGDAAAIARAKAHLTKFTPDDFSLADAQHVVARERGFESWPKLKAAIDAAMPFDQQIERLLAATRESQLGVVERVLSEHPKVAEATIFTAAAAARVDIVERALAQDPSLATATEGKEAWPPLAYACRSPLHKVSEHHAARLRAIAERLLDAGASASSGSLYFETREKAVPIPVLFHATMSDHVAMVELLLERGAVPNDGESIYHAAQYNRQACLERFAAHGADFSSRQPPYNNTPLFFLVGHHSDADGTAEWFKGMVWLLEHGADPNVPAYDKGETPLHGLAASAPKVATVRQIIAHGGDVNRRRADGRTPYRIAIRCGNEAIAALLVEAGAHTSDVTPIEAFLRACIAGNGDDARAMLAAQPDLIATFTDEDKEAVCHAATHRNHAAIRLMLALGFDLSWTRDGGTPLHWAAWFGVTDMVRFLIDVGAPVNARDKTFGSSALGWAAHGSGFHRKNDDAYCAIIDALVAAGADRESSINKWGEVPENMASKIVAKHLRKVQPLARSRTMNVMTIVDLAPMRLAIVTHSGPYAKIGPAFMQLGKLAGPGGLFAHPGAMMVGIYRDDPTITPVDRLRSAAGLIVPEGVAIPRPLDEERHGGGLHACYDYVGPYEGLPGAWKHVREVGFRATGRSRGEGPSLEIYRNDPSQVPEDQLITTICIPIAT